MQVEIFCTNACNSKFLLKNVKIRKNGPGFSLTHKQSLKALKWNDSVVPTYKECILFVTFLSIQTVKLGVSRHLLCLFCTALLQPHWPGLVGTCVFDPQALGEGGITTTTHETARIHWLWLQNPYREVFSR